MSCFRSTCRKHCANTPLEIVLIHWLAQIADDTVVQCPGPISIVGVGCHEDCRNSSVRIDKVSVQFEPGHGRHVDVGDEASRFREARGCEEIGCRWKGLDGVAQRAHEPSQGLAKEPIIVND